MFGVDALNELKKMQDSSVDMVLTDPPYGVKYQSAWVKTRPKFDKDIDATLAILSPIFEQVARVCKPTSHVYVFFPMSFYDEWRSMLERYFTVDPIPIIWNKNHFTPRDFKKGWARQYEPIFFCMGKHGGERELNYASSANVMTYAIPPGDTRVHDTQKPVDLLEYIIKNSSAEGEVVLDPFAGSGSTLAAAHKAGRYYIGFELEKSYEAPFKRWIGEL